MKTRITRELLTPIVTECLSMAQVLTRLGLVPVGGNYKTVYARIAEFGLSTSHFTGSGWNVGPRYKNFGKRILLEAALIEKSTYTSSFRLKTRLLAAGLKQRRCESCKNEAWLGQPIAL